MRSNKFVCQLSSGLLCLLLAGYAQAEEIGVKPQGNPTTARPAMVANPALAELLRDANALVKSGKALDAYNLLEPKEGDYSGDIAFDYLLGIAALDSGKPDRATIAFERVLIVNPNFSGARLDLGRAYLAMGSDDLAEKEFKIVLTQSPPAHVKPVVEKFLEAIAERKKAKLQQVATYLEFGVGHDSNVTSATSDFTKGVENTFNILGVQPTGSSLMRSASFGNLSGGLDYSRVIDEANGISVFAGIDLKKRWIREMSQLNNSNIDMRGGISIASDANTYRLFVNYGKYYQEGMTADTNSNRSTPALGAEWKHNFGERDQVSLTGQYSSPRFEKQETQNTNQTMLSASLLHIFDAGMTPLIYASVNSSNDRALKPLASGANMSRKTTGLRVHFQFTPIADTDVFLSGGLSRRTDSSPNARSALTPAVYGRDLTQDYSLGASWRPIQKWTVKAQITKYNNISNLSLYSYRRTESSVSVRRDF
jgi:tetratricopeptide (TPR) repeat protein